MANDRSYSNEVISGLGNIVEGALKRGLTCCPNCNHFDAMRETCGLNNLRPPAPIIAFGCERFDWNDCPF